MSIMIECGVCGSLISGARTQAEAESMMKEHRQGCSLTGGWFR